MLIAATLIFTGCSSKGDFELERSKGIKVTYIDEFEKIVKSKNVNIKITLDNRKFVFDLGKDEKKKLHSLISDYKKLEEKVCDDKQ